MAPKKIIAYYFALSGKDKNYHIKNIPGDDITHINYAFANISEEGEVIPGFPKEDTETDYPGDELELSFKGNYRELLRLKRRFPHLQTLISVGGWTWSGRFSDVAATEKGRIKFAKSCRKFIIEYGFDGIDIDWEYPGGGGMPENSRRPEDPQNYTLLMEAIRSELDSIQNETGRPEPYLLTTATSAAPHLIMKLDFHRLKHSLSFVNAMTYDYFGEWDDVSGHHSSLYCSEESEIKNQKTCGDIAVKAHLEAGLPPEQLMLGVPLYGRTWIVDGTAEDGPFQHVVTAQEEPGWDINGIREYIDTEQDYWDEKAKASWLFIKDQKRIVSYDNHHAAGEKIAYLNKKGLGGIMFWEISCDRSGYMTHYLGKHLKT